MARFVPLLLLLSLAACERAPKTWPDVASDALAYLFLAVFIAIMVVGGRRG